MGRNAVMPEQAAMPNRRTETGRRRRQEAGSVDQTVAPETGFGTLLALQRTVGNRGVRHLVEQRAPAPAGGQGGLGGLGRMNDSEDIDDEAATYLYDPRRNPHTLGQYLEPALAAERARSAAKLEAEAKAKEAREAEVRAKEAEERRARLAEEARAAEEAKAREAAEAEVRKAAELEARLVAEAAEAQARANAAAKKEARAKAREAKAKQEAEAAAKREKNVTDQVDKAIRQKLALRAAKLPADKRALIIREVIEKKLTSAEAAIKAEREVATVERQEQLAQLETDKVLLRRGVDALQPLPGVQEILITAINLHSMSNIADGLMIEKSFGKNDILVACRTWGLIPAQVVNGRRIRDQLQIVRDVHSPGHDKDDIDWKMRGDKREQTRNLILRIGSVRSNVHVRLNQNWRQGQ